MIYNCELRTSIWFVYTMVTGYSTPPSLIHSYIYLFICKSMSLFTINITILFLGFHKKKMRMCHWVVKTVVYTPHEKQQQKQTNKQSVVGSLRVHLCMIHRILNWFIWTISWNTVITTEDRLISPPTTSNPTDTVKDSYSFISNDIVNWEGSK